MHIVVIYNSRGHTISRGAYSAGSRGAYSARDGCMNKGNQLLKNLSKTPKFSIQMKIHKKKDKNSRMRNIIVFSINILQFSSQWIISSK